MAAVPKVCGNRNPTFDVHIVPRTDYALSAYLAFFLYNVTAATFQLVPSPPIELSVWPKIHIFTLDSLKKGCKNLNVRALWSFIAHFNIYIFI